MQERIRTEKRIQAMQAVKRMKKAIEKNKGLVTNEGEIISRERNWGKYDSTIDDFAGTFLDSLPEEWKKGDPDLPDEVFKRYIEETLSKGETGKLTAIEFGGPGSKLFSGFTRNFFNKTAGVCLKDNRDENLQKQDKQNHHSIIVEDILDPQRRKQLVVKITESLGTNKIDLIISRIVGPLRDLEMNPDLLDKIFRNWYELLDKNGLMFIQFEYCRGGYQNPNSNEILVREWINSVRNKYPQIDIQPGTNYIHDGIFRLHKKTGSPEKLPPATQLFK